jgi:hypothetical protein
MAESTLSISYSDLREELGIYLGWPRDPTNWTTDQVNAVAKILKGALRRWYTPDPLDGYTHRWSFMYPTATLTTVEPYDTGTVTIVAGVVTLAGGTFPSWAASGELSVGGNTYTVNTRDSDTQVTLDDTSVAAAAGSTYSLFQSIYDLPDDFGGLTGPLTYQPGRAPYDIEIPQTSEIEVRRLLVSQNETSPPKLYALQPKTIAAAGHRWTLLLWPIPDAAYRLTYPYGRLANTIDASNPYPYGGSLHSQTIKELVLAEAELMFHDEIGIHHQRALECLKASIEKDRLEMTPDTLGVDCGGRRTFDNILQRYDRTRVSLDF